MCSDSLIDGARTCSGSQIFQRKAHTIALLQRHSVVSLIFIIILSLMTCYCEKKHDKAVSLLIADIIWLCCPVQSSLFSRFSQLTNHAEFDNVIGMPSQHGEPFFGRHLITALKLSLFIHQTLVNLQKLTVSYCDTSPGAGFHPSPTCNGTTSICNAPFVQQG